MVCSDAYDPPAVRRIIQEVLNLPKEKQEDLAKLLERTTLRAIIEAAKVVADRLELLKALEHLITDHRDTLRERRELHRILAENTWVFGEQFNLTVDDESLTAVLERHLHLLGRAMKTRTEVLREDGKRGIVDLMLSRRVPLPRAEEREHLVVELKRPSQKVNDKVLNQIETYATAVAKDDRFRESSVRWTFLAISSDLSDGVREKASQRDRPPGCVFIAHDNTRQIYVKTWANSLMNAKAVSNSSKNGSSIRQARNRHSNTCDKNTSNTSPVRPDKHLPAELRKIGCSGKPPPYQLSPSRMGGSVPRAAATGPRTPFGADLSIADVTSKRSLLSNRTSARFGHRHFRGLFLIRTDQFFCTVILALRLGTMTATMFEMASVNQVRGVLLEEAILMLLRASGYRTVTTAAADPTLFEGPAGLNVWGRGGKHQIDAIADLRIGQPFSNPQRLLVEAKAYSNARKVGLPVVRGAVGVLKDVSEFWVKNGPDEPAASRYHYQFAIFSTSEFTGDAQDYAFAHDVHLLPPRGSSFFSPVVRVIEDAVEEIPRRRGAEVSVELSHVRHGLREQLQPNLEARRGNDFPWLAGVVNATQEVGASLIAMLGMAIPVFLTPRRDLDLNALPSTTRVQIHFGRAEPEASWTITRCDTGESMFTFDLPAELFERYAANGVLTRRAALNLKEDVFGQFTAIFSPQDAIRVFNFVLDQEWVTKVREDLSRRRRA